MSYLHTIIDFIQTLSLNDEEISKLLKEIDEMNRENTKHENQLEEFEREHIRLKIEYHNLDTISSFNDISAIHNLSHTSQKMYKDCVELKSLIDKIDFTKILQCTHMEMEAKCRKEWQPIEDCFVKTLNWHQQMEQRHIVQRYRQAEIELRKVEDASKNQLKSMEESLKQSVELIKQANDKRNNILISLIRGREDLENFSKKIMKLNQYQVYIEGLRKENLKVRNQLEQSHLKAFNPKLNLNSGVNFAMTIKPKEDISKFIIPKFPSFSDILESFKQADKVTNITAIENSTSFCVKSILHTSTTSITTKQTKNVHFKVQLEEYQEEITEIETETDVEEMPLETSVVINELQDNGENLQEMKDLANNSDIETIDLLTPANNTEKVIKETEEAIDYMDNEAITKPTANKSIVDIQDCVIFKTPFPLEEIKYIKDGEQDKENIPNNENLNHSKSSADMCASSATYQDIKEILNTTKKSFYEEFLNESSSAETSPTNNKNLESLLNENKADLYLSKDTKEEKQLNTKNYSSEMQDFLDFGSNRRFTFDSDDNLGNSYNSGNMDFM